MVKINPTPEVSYRYGAPMGRHTGPNYLETSQRLTLRRIPINYGGFDAGGAYWGCGLPLYWAADEDGHSQFFRAFDREAAKAKIREDWPDARFYR